MTDLFVPFNTTLNSMELEKNFDPKRIEDRWYSDWNQQVISTSSCNE